MGYIEKHLNPQPLLLKEKGKFPLLEERVE
jgi:hypothetical protein